MASTNSSCYLYYFSLRFLSPPFPPIFLSAPPLEFPQSAHFPAMATSSMKGNTAPLEGALKGKDIAADEGSLGLDSLRPGFSGTLEVLICRSWDIHNTNDRYRTTEYIVSDQHGNAVLCSVRGNISHCFVSKLEEGRAFSLKNFSVVPNKETFALRNSDEYIIELEGFTVVKKIEGPVDAYTRFPFQLVPLEDIILNDSTYLIDVMGYVIEVDNIRRTRTGSELIDAQIINSRGTRVRLTLWGSLCSEFAQRREKQSGGAYIAIFLSMQIKEFRGEVYLSSTSATTIFDTPDIPQIAEFIDILKASNAPPKLLTTVAPTFVAGTLAQLLQLGRAAVGQRTQRNNGKATLQCSVRFNNVRTKNSWFYFACGKGNCRKGATRKGAILWCDACNSQCDFPRTSYKLHVDVADATCGLVITLFDEIVETLIKKKASKLLEEVGDNVVQTVLPQEIHALMNTRHTLEFRTNTYYTNGHYESFIASKLVADDQDKQVIEPTSVGPDGEPAVKATVKRRREESINIDGCMENTDATHWKPAYQHDKIYSLPRSIQQPHQHNQTSRHTPNG